MVLDKRAHRMLAPVRDDAGDQLATLFQHAKHNRLVLKLRASTLAANDAANERFVNLDHFANAAQRIVAVE